MIRAKRIAFHKSEVHERLSLGAELHVVEHLRELHAIRLQLHHHADVVNESGKKRFVAAGHARFLREYFGRCSNCDRVRPQILCIEAIAQRTTAE